MNMPNELHHLESKLQSISPAASQLDRDALMYEAGRASIRRSRKHWQGICALLLLVAGGLYLDKPNPQPVQNLVQEAPRPQQQPQFDPPVYKHVINSAVLQYAQMRSRVLKEGLDALPAFRERKASQPTEAPLRWQDYLENPS